MASWSLVLYDNKINHSNNHWKNDCDYDNDHNNNDDDIYVMVIELS